MGFTFFPFPNTLEAYLKSVMFDYNFINDFPKDFLRAIFVDNP